MKAKQTKQRNDHSSCANVTYVTVSIGKNGREIQLGPSDTRQGLFSFQRNQRWPFRLFIIIILQFLLRMLQVLFSYILHRFHLLYKASCTQLARSSDALGDSLTSIGRRCSQRISSQKGLTPIAPQIEVLNHRNVFVPVRIKSFNQTISLKVITRSVYLMNLKKSYKTQQLILK